MTVHIVLLQVSGDGERPKLPDCIVSHLSTEPGHKLLLSKIGKSAVLDLQLRLGEGTGAALMIPLIKAALACHNGMATFAEAEVSTKIIS